MICRDTVLCQELEIRQYGLDARADNCSSLWHSMREKPPLICRKTALNGKHQLVALPDSQKLSEDGIRVWLIIQGQQHHVALAMIISSCILVSGLQADGQQTNPSAFDVLSIFFISSNEDTATIDHRKFNMMFWNGSRCQYPQKASRCQAGQTSQCRLTARTMRMLQQNSVTVFVYTSLSSASCC